MIDELILDSVEMLENSIVTTKTLIGDSILANSIAVNEALNELQKDVADIKKATVKDDKNKFNPKEIAGFIDELNDAIPILLHPKSGLEVASAVLSVTSKFIKVIGVIPGVGLAAGIASSVLKLTGTIIGSLGDDEKTDYYKMLEGMIKQAVDNLSLNTKIDNLVGEINSLKAKHRHLAGILAKTYTDEQLKNVWKTNAADLTPSKINDIAESVLGQAYNDISRTANDRKSTSWKVAADVFFCVNEVVAYKALYMLECLSYFKLIEKIDNNTERFDELKRDTGSFMSTYAKNSELYFARPTITTSVITHWLYRLPWDSFDFIVRVYDGLVQADPKETEATQMRFFPNTADQYRFNCKVAKKHDRGPKNDTETCARFTTLFDRRKTKSGDDIDRRSLTIPRDKTETTKASYDSGMPGGKLWMAPDRYHAMDTADKDPDKVRSHFALWADSSGRAPFYNWFIQSKNEHTEFYRYTQTVQVQGHTAEVLNKESALKKFISEEYHFYAFYVYPTAAELNDNAWPSKWENKPDKNRKYFMIGSRGGDKEQVWVTYDDHFRKVSAYDALYNNSKVKDVNGTYGCPDRCLWFMLDEKG